MGTSALRERQKCRFHAIGEAPPYIPVRAEILHKAMSQEKVEVVQQGYMDVNAFMRGNLSDGSLEHLLDPQIEWDWNLRAARPPGTPERVQGAGELLAFLERVREEWSDVAVEPLEFIDGSDGRVLVCARQFRRLSDEAALDTLEVFHLWTIRNGRVSRLEIFLDRGDALEAAGGEQ